MLNLPVTVDVNLFECPVQCLWIYGYPEPLQYLIKLLQVNYTVPVSVGLFEDEGGANPNILECLIQDTDQVLLPHGLLGRPRPLLDALELLLELILVLIGSAIPDLSDQLPANAREKFLEGNQDRLL